MKTIVNSVVALAIVLSISACNNTHTDATSNANLKDTVASESFEIIGKKGFIVFPAGIKVEEDFLSDSTLHWKFIDNNGAREGDEHITYKKLNNNLFFINWIEKTGLTVS